MRTLALATVVAVVTVASACGDDGSPTTPDAPVAPITPTPNPARGISETKLSFDVTTFAATAQITFEPSTAPGATLEVGDLTLDTVQQGGAALAFAVKPGTNVIDLALDASDAPVTIDIAFHYKNHTGFAGAAAAGYTFLWPYYCGNLFPCHSQPRDGLAMTLAVTGVPAGKIAVFPQTIAEAPSYQLAWSIDAYTELPLGTTAAGTQVSVWYRPTELALAQTGTANLVAAFQWLETTIGPYRFGNKVGTVSVKWGPGAYGGMEHHPLWHVSAGSLDSQETNVHEAAHGWFGDGIRIECWEDFVLSEGTVTYLAGRALDVVAPTVGAAVWQSYASELAGIPAPTRVWPQSCGTVDIFEGRSVHQRAVHARGVLLSRGGAEGRRRQGRPGAPHVLHGARRQDGAHGGHARHDQDRHGLRRHRVHSDLADQHHHAHARRLSVARTRCPHAGGHGQARRVITRGCGWRCSCSGRLVPWPS
ncbi:MAG: peptidase M1 [Myxococcales bacterium]|nr:peptidase M1 [Myxococcales bacterium]